MVPDSPPVNPRNAQHLSFAGILSGISEPQQNRRLLVTVIITDADNYYPPMKFTVVFHSTGEQNYSGPRDRDNDKNRMDKRLPADEKEIYIKIPCKNMFEH